MEKQYLTIQEVTTITGKHINTIRSLIKNNKIKYTQKDRRYLIHKDDLALYYKDLKDKIFSFGEDSTNSVTNDVTNNISNNSIEAYLKPLSDQLQYQISRYEETQKLLVSSEHEKIKLEKDFLEKLESQKSQFENEKKSISDNLKKEIINKTLILKILLAVIVLLMVGMLIQGGILKINI